MKEANELREYNIDFVGLKNGMHEFRFKAGQSLLDYFSYDDGFSDPEVDVILRLNRQQTYLEFGFSHKGSVLTSCDVSGREFRLPIEGEYKIIVKLGSGYEDMGDELIEIPLTEHRVNVANWIYESIVLSVPMKRVCSDGLKNEAEEGKQEEKHTNDPRWDKLKELITKKDK